MKKTILRTAMLAAIASLAMSGYAWAHHPSQDIVPENVLDLQNVSEQHITIVDGLLDTAEDDTMMANTSQGADGGDPTSASGDGSTASDGDAAGMSVDNAGEAPVSPGSSTASQAGRR